MLRFKAPIGSLSCAMATTLGPDQQAVLQLVLKRDRSYRQIAELLAVDEDTIAARARSALERLDPAPQLAADVRSALADYTLGQHELDHQLSALIGRRSPERDHLEALLAALIAAEIAERERLPTLPPLTDTGDDSRPRVSRTGGAIVLGLLAAVVLLAVLWATGVLAGDADQSTATTATTTEASPGARVERQVNLKSTGGRKRELAVANVVSQDGERAIVVVASGVRAADYYGLWLRGRKRNRFLGFFQAVTASDDGTRRLQATTASPAGLSSYREILITRERSGNTPPRPGTTLLRGSLVS